MPKKLSVKIGSRKITIVEGIRSKNNLSVSKYINIDTPANSVEDGRIIDVDIVSKTIKNALDANKIRTKNVGFVLNTSSLITRIIKLPYVQNYKDALSMIKFELEQSMPIDLNRYYFIYRIVDTYIEDDVKKAEYSIYGIENEMFDQYLELADKIKVVPIFLDLTFNNLSYIYKNNLLINDNSITDEQITGFIDFSNKTTNFSILHNGANDFSRVIKKGFKDIEDSLIEQFSMSKEDIINFVKDVSLINSVDNDSVRMEIVKKNIDICIDELNRYIKYYNSKSKDAQIDKVYVYGMFSNIKNFDIYLSRALGIDIVIVQSLSNVKVVENTNDIFIMREYFDNILALYYVKEDISFLSEKNIKHKINFNKFFVSITVSSIVLIVVLYFSLVYFSDSRLLKNEIKTMNVFLQKDSNMELLNQSEEIKAKVLILEEAMKKLAVANDFVHSKDIINVDIIQKIASNAPNDTVVKSLSIDAGSIQIQCLSNNRSSSAQYEKNIKKLDFANSVYIPSIVQVDVNNVKQYSYVIICSIGEVNSDETEQ